MSDVLRIASGAPWEARVGYSRAVRAGGWVHVAGTTATVDGVVVHPGDAGAQAGVAFDLALAALARVGGRPADVVRTRMYLVDVADQQAVGREHLRRFGDAPPAATMVAVVALADPAHLVEIELEAWLG